LAPCHEDKNNSFSIRDCGNGKIDTKCHAGCDSRRQIAALKVMGLLKSPRRNEEGADKDALARTYGLSWRDFEQAGCVLKSWPINGEFMPCVVYPLHNGGAKIKSVARYGKGGEILSWPQGKRSSVHKSGGGSGWFDPAPSLESDLLVLTAGEEKAIAAVKAGFRAVSWSSGEGKPSSGAVESLSYLPRVPVVVAMDNDNAGRKGGKAWLEKLKLAGFDARKLVWPEGVADKFDLADWLREKGAESLRDLLLSERPEQEEDEENELLVGFDERAMVESCLRILAKSNLNLYQRGRVLVEVPENEIETEGSRPIRILSPTKIRVLLSSLVKFVSSDGKMRQIPRVLPTAISEWGEYEGFRELVSVLEYPALIRGNKIVREPGYYPESGTLLVRRNRCYPEMHPNPTAHEATIAAQELLDDFRDFPFETDIDRAAFLAYCLTVVCRDAVTGQVPGFIFTANDQGAGKTNLAIAPWLFCSGKAPGVFGGLPRSAEELDKRILAAIHGGQRGLIFDNVTHRIGGEALAVLLTSAAYQGRILGSTQTVTVKNNWVVAITANNAAVDTDQATRSVFIRLLAPPGHRERDQSSYKTPDFAASLIRNSAHVIRCLTILQAYILAGTPNQNQKSLRDFHGWTRLVSGAVVWSGLPDPLGRQKELARESDEESDNLLQFLSLIYDGQFGVSLRVPFSTADLVQWAQGQESFRAVLSSLRIARGLSIDNGMLGRVLRRLNGKPVDGFCLEKREGRNPNGGALWEVKRIFSEKEIHSEKDEVPF
jgi:hypothetical protein